VEGEGKTAAAGPQSPEPDRKYLKKNDIFQLGDDIRNPGRWQMGRSANLAGGRHIGGRRPIAVGSHSMFFGFLTVHSGPGDVINDPIPVELSVFAKKFALTA
jgi:hypothetical protein